MTSKNNLKSILIAIIFLGLFCFCATQKPIVTSPMKASNYDYQSPQPPNKQNISLALIKPAFARNMKATDLRMFNEFSDKMGIDFEEMVTNRGYTLRGPFVSSDDLVYNDKQSCALMIQPEILIDMDWQNVKSNSKSSYDPINKIYKYRYSFEGNVMMKGTINLIFSEPFTKEKIKVQSISLPQKDILIKSERNDFNTTNIYEIIKSNTEPGINNPLIIGLEDYYQSAFKTAYNHLDPDQVKEYVESALKARKERK